MSTLTVSRQMKTKICNQCGEEYQPRKPLQSVCDLKCALDQSREKQKAAAEKAARKKYKLDKDRIKTKADWAKEAQQAFNTWIRERDYRECCISCGRIHQGQYHAGHFRTTKAASQLRFNPYNCHKQCQPCNTHLSGNVTEYRISLIKRIGLDRVEALENNNDLAQHDIRYYKRVKSIFNRRARLYRRLHGQS